MVNVSRKFNRRGLIVIICYLISVKDFIGVRIIFIFVRSEIGLLVVFCISDVIYFFKVFRKC